MTMNLVTICGEYAMRMPTGYDVQMKFNVE